MPLQAGVPIKTMTNGRGDERNRGNPIPYRRLAGETTRIGILTKGRYSLSLSDPGLVSIQWLEGLNIFESHRQSRGGLDIHP